MKNKTLITIVLILYLLFLPDFLFEADIKVKAIVTLVIIQILWIGRIFPLAHSSIILMLLLSFHFFSYKETLSYVASEIVWLMFSTFFISHAFINTGLASRVSLHMLKLSKGSGKGLIFISYFLMFVLSMMIPSNVGKASLVVSVFDRLLQSLNKMMNVENLGKALFIGVCYLSAISGSFVATGASSTIYTFGILGELSTDLNYLTWIFYFAPPIILFTIILWLLFLFVYPPENINRHFIIKLIEERINELGKISISEIKIMFIIGLTITLWATQPIHQLSIPLIGLLGAALTFTPLIGVWKWGKARESVDWDMMLFFAATIMISQMLIKTGTIDMIAEFLMNGINMNDSSIMVLFILLIIIALLRVIFVNVLGFLTIVLPLAITMGESLSDLSPFMVTMSVFLIGVPGFLLITQSPVHLIAYSYKYFTERDLLRIGSISNVVWIFIVLFFAVCCWRFIT
ncbi:SLC13 family permease [Oceanobacillus senegalensis]|uniref:SLC13 family permease n=1 Tax=Oceanobacillus senegalensis TaxID=1936063 RepID=UPI000A30585A|nr:SLC13 family permease [Oceanobacillus senegalensis]